jgi:protein archease
MASAIDHTSAENSELQLSVVIRSTDRGLNPMRRWRGRSRIGSCCAARPGDERSEVSYRWVEHTAEVQLEIEAQTEEAVFVDALLALAELLGDDGRGDHVSRGITVDGGERAVMLLEWLDELVFLAETEDLVPEDVGRIELSDRGLVARIGCRRGSPRHLVKGATYHRLAFERLPDGYRASVVLDV